MAAKVATLIITFLINISIGVVTLFFMLLAMNGYSESDSTPGLLTFIVLTFLTAMVMSFAGFFAAGKLIKKNFKPAISVLIAAPAFSIIGAVLIFLASIAGVGVAEYVRVNY